MKIQKWLKEKQNIHYLIYVLGVFFFYIINFFRVNGTGGQWAFGNEFIGPIVFVMLFARLGIKLLKRMASYVWTIVSAVALPIAFFILRQGNDYDLQLAGRCVNIWLMGLSAIGVFSYYFANKTEIRLSKLSKTFWIWLSLVFVCVISVNESSWPAWALLGLGSFYVAPLDDQEKKAMVHGIVDGIIICFFVYEGHALLYCPYDQLRYTSFFSNSDCSAKFFTATYIGFLTKHYILSKEGAKRWRKILCFLFAGSMWGFWFFTITRSSMIGMATATIAFLVAETVALKEKFLKLLAKGAILAVFFLISIPIIYGAIRYIPALRHHPVFITAYSEDKVHSWDPIDSEKYIKFQTVLGAYSSRFAPPEKINLENDYLILSGNTEETLKAEKKAEVQEENGNVGFALFIATIEELSEDGECVVSYKDGIEPGSDENHPYYVVLTYNNVFERYLGIRKYLYKNYFETSSWLGSRNEYHCVWIDAETIYNSAHNSTLDFMSRYGYIAAALYFALQISIMVTEAVKIVKNRDRDMSAHILCILCAAAYFGWGLFYSVAFTGEILDTLFWVCAIFAMRKEEPERIETANE